MTVVLLPPLGSDAGFWKPVLPLLDDAIALDLLGQADAGQLPRGAGVREMGEAVLARLDELGLARVDVAGISLGGLIAQWLAAHHPDRVDSVTLIDTVAQYPPAMQTMWHDRAVSVRANGTETIIPSTLALWFTPEFLEKGGEIVERSRATLVDSDTEGYARTCELLESADTRDLLGRISCPTLLVCGVADAEPFRLALDVFSAAIPHARVAWLPGGHAAAAENASAFAAAVQEFLTTRVGSPAGRSSHGGAS